MSDEKPKLPFKTKDGEYFVPARWITVAFVCLFGSSSSALYLAFSAGSKNSEVTFGYQNLMGRVSAIEASRAAMSPEILQRVTRVESGVEFLKEQNRQILDMLQRAH